MTYKSASAILTQPPNNRQNGRITVILLALIFAFLYYHFIVSHAPLGIKWRPFHEERVLNALQNIHKNNILLRFGFTSWMPAHHVSYQLNTPAPDLYLVTALPYLAHILLQSILTGYRPALHGAIVDYCLITYTGILITLLFYDKSNITTIIEKIYWSVAVFTIYLTSPWAYRMSLSMWHEVPFLAFYLTSIMLITWNKVRIGLIFSFLAALINWEWAFLIVIFVSAYLLICRLLNKTYTFTTTILPSPTNSGPMLLPYLASLLMGVGICWFQALGAKLIGINHVGGSFLYRVGVDKLENIHHGGFLAALQFLGGNRLSMCMPEQLGLEGLNSLNTKIAFFNCLSSIGGTFVLSSISIIGFILLSRRRDTLARLLAPLTWSFLVYMCLFQQSFSVHLQGHSFVFTVIYSLGLASVIRLVSSYVSRHQVALSIPVSIPLIGAVIITSIRVSYYTGYNG